MGKKSDISGPTMAQMVCLKELGYTTKVISERCGVCPRSVRRWIAVYNCQDRHTLPTQKKRPGKPKKTGKLVVNIVKRELEKNPRVSARKVKQNNPEIIGECSIIRTVNRRISDLGYTSHHPVKKPLLTLKQRKNRVAFAKKYLQWDMIKWLSVCGVMSPRSV